MSSKPMYSSYVLWILYSLLLSNTRQVIGCKDHKETQDESTPIAVVFMIVCALIHVLCVLLFKRCTKSDQTKREAPNSVPSAIISEAVTIERNVSRNISDLRPFSSTRPHVHYSIRPTTKQRIMADLMDKARETRRFSILPEFKGLIGNSISIQIALCEPSHTLLAVIEYFDPATMHCGYFDYLRRLFSIIFHRTNIIQTWGDLRNGLSPFFRADLLSNEQIENSGFMDVQKRFKPWYNQVFPHQQQCQQRLDYDYTDGPLCSCSHRPCKSSADQWPLSSAIAYTFDEFLHEGTIGITRCFAITKLALAIDEKWTREQVNDYVKQRKAAYEEEWVHLFS